MTLTEQLKAGEAIFKQILEASSNPDTSVYPPIQYLFNLPQPPEWIESEVSTLIPGQIFEYNKIQLIEAVMDRIFPGWYSELYTVQITQEKNIYAVTSTATIRYMFKDQLYYRYGVATTFAQSIKHLQLATPLSYTEAKKNAIKQIGKLFGRDLSRIDNALPVVQVEKKDEVDNEFEEFKNSLSNLSKSEAETKLKNSPWKYNVGLAAFISNLK